MNSIECLKQYNSNDDDVIWFSPLGHPDIEYRIFPKSLGEEGMEIYFIGDLVKEYKKTHEYKGLLVAFVDDNGKIISPVLFHDPLTTCQGVYKEIYGEIIAFSERVFGGESPPTDEQTESEFSEKTLPDVLDESYRGNQKFYSLIERAILSGKIENSIEIQQYGFTVEQICEALEDMKKNPEKYDSKYSRHLHTIIQDLKDVGVPSYE